MNKLLVAVEAHNYAAPSKATVRQYLPGSDYRP